MMPDNPKTYIEDGYLKFAAINRCVNLLLNKVASVPVIIYEEKEGATNQKFKEFQLLNKSLEIPQKFKAQLIKVKTLTETTNKELQKLIDEPNDMQSWDDWVKYFVGSYLLTGNAYDYFNGPVIDIEKPEKNIYSEHFVLPTGMIQIISGGMNKPVKSFRMEYGTNQFLDYPESQIIHWKSFNPEFMWSGSQLYGISVLRAYLEPILRNKLGDKELSRQMANGGVFGFIGAKNPEHNLSIDQKKEMKQALIDAKKSNDEISRIFPTGIPLEWTSIGLPVADLKLIEVANLDEESIYKAFNVPLVYSNQDSASYNNQSTADKQFIYNAIAPLCEDIGSLLTKKLCKGIEKRTGKKFRIYLDYNALPEMQADMSKISDWLSKSPELTYNEKREAKGYGRLEITGMDSIFISGNERLIEDAAIPMSDFPAEFDTPL
ncbi:MAG TPA: phage portal protein [Ignavibacteriaceae bacterium]